MMRRTGSYALVTRPGYRALRLPYEVGPLGMIIVLPDEVDALDTFATGSMPVNGRSLRPP